MKATFTSILFALTLFLGKTSACDCLPVPTFCETITEDNGQISYYISVFRVSVTAKLANGVQVSVAESFAGENLAGHTLEFESGNDADCFMSLDSFQVGETYVFASQKRTDALWGLTFCGVTFLKVENDTVQGAIAPGVEQVALADFKNLANCGNLNPAVEPPAQPDFKLFAEPTLVANELKIKTNHLLGADLDLQIFDAVGRLVHAEKVPAFNFYHTLVVDVQAWSAGIYFVKMEMAGRRQTVKVARQ